MRILKWLRVVLSTLALGIGLCGAPAAMAQNLKELYEAARGFDATYRAAQALAQSAEFRVAAVEGLARPSAAERWVHAHCVRNCLDLDWQSLLSALATRASSVDPHPFVDRGLHFYEWHARQWLCLALARGSIDAPRAVAPTRRAA